MPSVRAGLTLLWLGLLTACAAADPTPEVALAPTPGAETPGAAAAGSEDAGGPAASELITFSFDPSATEARFVIGEILSGQPNTVIGVSDQVTGEIMVDPSNPVRSQLGTITIDAGSFVTDNNLRNRAINQFILQIGSYPTITFTPATIVGPGQVSVGQTAEFRIAGDLTIRDITRPVTFEATLTVDGDKQISGSATATILRSVFDLTIPSVPRVAGVEEEIVLEFEFVARAN